MAQVLKVQQVPVSPLNGHSEKNRNGMSIEESTASSPSVSAGLTHIHNGAVLFHGTPTKDLNGASTSIETDDNLQLSPGDLRRRSTRASALKAQEKIKLKDDIVQGSSQKRTNEEESAEGNESIEETLEAQQQPGSKKRRLEDGRDFDQTCFRFGLRANEDGEVYAMTDESENSSIHDSEMEIVRYHYVKMMNREPDEEQLRERLKMRREAENQLREEEGKLSVLKKMKDSQHRAINKLAAETKAADMAEAANAAAYKPVVANPGSIKTSASAKAQAMINANKTMAGLASLTIQQQLELLGKLASQSPAAKQAYQMAKKNPSQTTQLFGQLIQINSMQIQKQKEAEAAAAAAGTAATPTQATVAASASASSSSQSVQQVQPIQQQQQPMQQQQPGQITQQKLLNQQTPAQRIQAARLAFRAQADKQLMTIPTQKSQPHDITFLPNPNAAAFLALHGLDLVVQSVLKDKDYDKSYSGPTYECEECRTDCAHTWKAIGSSPDDLHLYCENCVRSAQKRKNRTDQTSLLKRAFQKITAQEKEFEKKIAEGQLEQFAEAKAAVATASTPSTQQIPTSSTATVSSTPLGPRLPAMSSSSGTSTPTQAMKSSTPLPPTPKSSNSNQKKALSAQQQASQMMAQFMSNSMRSNPAMMQQMLQMFSMAQAAQAAQQVQAAQAQGRNMQSSGMNTNQMAILMAQAQAMAQVQAQAAAAQQAAQQAQAQQQQAKNARESQNQNAMLMAILAGHSGNQQAIQQLKNLTPSQQKALIEAFKSQQKK